MSDRAEGAISWALTVGGIVLMLVAGPYKGLVVAGYLVAICALLVFADWTRRRATRRELARRASPHR
jgi:tetrahydromethanopterin S-methyltransferase subunit C